MTKYGQFWTPEDSDFSQTGMCGTTYPAPFSTWPARCIRANDTSNRTPVGPGAQLQAWYYDGALVFQQIATYTGNKAMWSQGVANVMDVYRDNYVIPSSGGLQGYLVFTEGLYKDYIANGTAASKTAIDLLDTNASYATSFWADFTQTSFQREAAYRLEADLWASKLDNPVRYGHPASYWLQYDVAHVVGMIDQQCTQGKPYEYFMAGLQAEALIKYYVNGHSSDVRIPAAVKQLADCIWSSGWGQVADDPYAFPYSSAYSKYGFTMAGTGAQAGASNEALNLLIAPMYAWLYSVTGNATYLAEGDTIWQDGVLMPTSGGVGGTIGWTGNGGKQFSQSYRWSFNYVQWRSAASGPSAI